MCRLGTFFLDLGYHIYIYICQHAIITTFDKSRRAVKVRKSALHHILVSPSIAFNRGGRHL